jgi:hypothetical protein
MAKSLHVFPFMLARAKMVFAVFVCVFSTNHSIWALEIPAPQSNLLNIEEDCVETNSISTQGPSHQLLQYVDSLKDVMKTKDDSGSLVFDGKQSLCSIYSEDCQEPIEETFVKTPESLEDVKIVLVNTNDASRDSQSETVARALDENANLVQINSETNEQTTIQFSERIKEILSQAQGQFDPSGKTYKLSGLTEEQKQHLREELQQTAIDENSQTGELSLNLDQVFESASKQSLTESQPAISSVGGGFQSPANYFGSLHFTKEEIRERTREEICKRVEKMHLETSVFYQDCIRRGLIDPTNSTRNEKTSSWSANILRATRSELNRPSSASKQWPSTFPYVYPRPVISTVQNTELNSAAMNQAHPSTNHSLNSTQSSGISTLNSEQTLKISDASKGQGRIESDDLAEQTIKDMVAALMNSHPQPIGQKSAPNESQFLKATSLNEDLKGLRQLSPRSQILVAEALSLRNKIRDFKKSKLSLETDELALSANAASVVWKETELPHFYNHETQSTVPDFDAQPTSGQQDGPSAPSNSSEIEIPLFVLPERRRYAPETDSDEPPHS